MIRRPPKSTLFPYPTLSRSDQERAVESDEHGPEVPLAEAPVEQSARDLGEPVVHPRQDRENASTEQHVVEVGDRSEEHTSELQSPCNLVCRLLLEKKKVPCIAPAHHTRSTTSSARDRRVLENVFRHVRAAAECCRRERAPPTCDPSSARARSRIAATYLSS